MPHIEGIIEIGTNSDNWGPKNFDLSKNMPSEDTISSFTVAAYAEKDGVLVDTGDVLTNYQNIQSDIIDSGVALANDDTTLNIHLKYPGDAYRGKRMALVFTVTFTVNSSVYDYFFHHVYIPEIKLAVRPISRIINTKEDTTYPMEVRTLLGITANDLSDDALKSDILIGVAEREIVSSYVDNWISVLNGDDEMAQAALRSSVIIKVALNVLSSPAIQNILIDQVRLIDIIITAKKVSLEDLRNNLESLLNQQLLIVGVEHTDGYPVSLAIGRTDNLPIYQFAVSETGSIVQIR